MSWYTHNALRVARAVLPRPIPSTCFSTYSIKI